jgi:hypothetical protein
MAKRRSRASKSARRRANKSAAERRKAKAAKQAGNKPSTGSATAKQASTRTKVIIPEPSSKADPEAALNAVAAYREAFNQWKSLPFWKRLFTSKPRHPTGV